jgi:serine/threonine-protein kinase
LRRELEVLLAEGGPAESLLEAPARHVMSDLTASDGVIRSVVEPGKMLGLYRIERLLGRGGMGSVFLAYDTTLHRRVALKVMDASAAAPTSRAQTVREARNAAALNHPNICTIYEVGEVDGAAFIAMEYVEGRSLRERLDDGAFALEDTISYGMQAADALAYAHDHGVVHRDFKAANVIVTESGRLKVVDFGLARRDDALMASATTLASIVPADAVAGTPYAMAPEQVRGEVADSRSDIWALGVLLYEMLSGATPFRAATIAELFSSILRDAPATLPGTRPAALRALVDRCLEKAPERRPQRANEVLDALATMRAGTVPRWMAWPDGLSRRRWLVPAAAFLGVVAIVLGWNVEGRPDTAGGAASVRSIAVLPLRNLSASRDDYFSDGITEELVTTLAQIRSLRVISRTSIMRFKGSDVPLRQIAQELGVDAVIEGSIQRAGDRVRVTAQLIDARTDTHLWAHAYDERLADVLTLQAAVAREIAGQVAVRLSPEEARRLSAPRAVDPAAHDEFLRGEALRWRGFNDVPRAIEHYDRAVAIDPRYAQAYAGMALAWTGARAPGSNAAARAAAMQAVALDPSLPEGHAALAAVKYRDWDWEGGHAESRLALEANPAALDGCFCYAIALASTGYLSEALAVADQSILGNPLAGAAYLARGNALFFARRYDEAIATYRRGQELDPGYATNRSAVTIVSAETGRPADAVALLEPADKRDSPLAGLVLATAYAHVGRRSDALQLIARFTGAGQTPDASFVARAYLALGDRDRGLAWLERSVDAHEPNAHFILLSAFDSVRQEPRFRTLVKRMNFSDKFEAAEAAFLAPVPRRPPS